jgi:hypothetical protein
VFIGGYFYDPFYGPYPWWRPGPYRYYPVYDYRAELKVKAVPREAAVYVDGYYAGIADDFDGMFQHLLLPPGGHSIALYLEGFRTVRHNLYLRPASTLTLHEQLLRLPPGVRSEPPDLAPPLPPPPYGSYRAPRTAPPPALPPPPPPSAEDEEDGVQALGFGTVDIRIQPLDAVLTVDDQAWTTSEPGHFVLQLANGVHRVAVTKVGHHSYATTVTVREGVTTPLNVSLPPER